MTVKDINLIFREGLNHFVEKNKHGCRSFLMVYCAGHGVSDQQQYFVLNELKANIVAIELKLRGLSKNTDTNILAFYDICRSDKSAFPNLKTRGGEGGEAIVPESEALFAEQYEYAHVGTNPSSTVAAESMLSAMIMKKLDDASDKDPNGLVSIPTDLAGIG